ncbi:unnamed protein product [Malus baccata var. baccata]
MTLSISPLPFLRQHDTLPFHQNGFAPHSDKLKINIDGAWIMANNLGGFGGIVRDEMRCFLVAKCGHFVNVFSLLQAARQIEKVRFGRCLGDCGGLKDPSTNLSPVGQVVEDIKALLFLITKASFTHTRRQTNGVIHRLARIGVTSSQSSEWFKPPPQV